MGKSVVIPDRFAIMAVDPGGTSGVGTGVFRTDRGDDMLTSVIERANRKQQIRTWEVGGPCEEQAWVIVDAWANFRFKCNVEYGIDFPDIHLVFESFHLRTQQAKLQPVMVTYGVLTLMRWSASSAPWPVGQPVYQEPSTAKRVSNDRLRKLGVWVKGSEHQRDAMRHIVAKVSDII